jgi:ABC-type nickel/cobalt efflux system permease component RcnA
MFGLDDHLAQLSEGSSVLVVLAIAILLGLRHATDPDHLAAVTVLVAGRRERGQLHAARLGAMWGIGHATTLIAFGLPIVLAKAYLPDTAQRSAETAVGVVIGALAFWLLVRWRRGVFHVHLHRHEHGHDPEYADAHAHGRTAAAGRPHVHLHGAGHAHAHGVAEGVRTPRQAFGVGLLHGIGGSAGVGVLLVATIDSRPLAVASLGLLAIFAAVSMALVSTGFGATLASARVGRSLHRVVPALGVGSLAFGTWYALGALSLVPYVL